MTPMGSRRTAAGGRRHIILQGTKAETCQVCGHRGLTEVWDLGNQPICNALLEKRDLGKPELYYPLRLAFCPSCALLELYTVVSGKKGFKYNYNYII